MKNTQRPFNPTAMALAIVFVWLLKALLVLGFWCLVILALCTVVFGA